MFKFAGMNKPINIWCIVEWVTKTKRRSLRFINPALAPSVMQYAYIAAIVFRPSDSDCVGTVCLALPSTNNGMEHLDDLSIDLCIL